MKRKRRSLLEFLADMDHWAGFTNDPAETTHWCIWISFHWFQVFIHPDRIEFHALWK